MNSWNEVNPRVIRPSPPIPDPEFHYARRLLVLANLPKEDIAGMSRDEVIDASLAVRASLDIPEECKTPTNAELKRMTSSELAVVKEEKNRLGCDLHYEVQDLKNWDLKLCSIKGEAQKWASPETMALFEKVQDDHMAIHRKKYLAKESVQEILRVIKVLEKEILDSCVFNDSQRRSKKQKVDV